MVDGGAIREVTNVSWFGRLKRSVGGLLFGLLLVLMMIVLLFWNEGRAVQTARSLDEGAGIVVPVAAATVNPANDGRLVHLSGRIAATQPAVDPDFGISASGVRLERQVEMYQWKEESRSETRTKLGGGEETVTTYSYSQGWSSSREDSARFKEPAGHDNPEMLYEGRNFQIPAATLGAFQLDARVLDKVGGGERYAVPSTSGDAVQAAVGAWARATVVNGGIYVGRDPQSPAIGDYRVSYSLVPLEDVTIVGRQTGQTLDYYQTQAGDQLLMVRTGTLSAEAMFDAAKSDNTVITWIIRAVGLLFLCIAFGLVLSPLGVAADVIPFLGSIVRLGTGIVATVAGVLVGSATIAIAWFWYRPVLSLIIMAVGAAIAVAVIMYGRSRAKSQPAATA